MTGFDGRVIVFTGYVNQQIKWNGEKVVYRPVNVWLDYPRIEDARPLDNHNYTYRWYRV